MATLTSYTINRLLQRLGVKDAGNTPQNLVDAIQPVMGVGDASALTPPILAPSAIAGSNDTSAAGVSIACGVCTAGPTGSFVRPFIGASAATRAALVLDTFAQFVADGLTVNATPPLQQLSARVTCRAVVRIGTSTNTGAYTGNQTLLAGLNIHLASNTTVELPVFYLQPGQSMLLCLHDSGSPRGYFSFEMADSPPEPVA